MTTTIILIVVVVAFVAWMVIPGKPRAQQAKPTSEPSQPMFAPQMFTQQQAPAMGPFAASVEEKMAVVEHELRKRQSERYRSEVIDEIADLIAKK